MHFTRKVGQFPNLKVPLEIDNTQYTKFWSEASHGGMNETGDGCTTLHLSRIARWWQQLRRQHRFILNASIINAAAGKKAPRRQHNLSLSHLSRTHQLRAKQTTSYDFDTPQVRAAKLQELRMAHKRNHRCPSAEAGRGAPGGLPLPS